MEDYEAKKKKLTDDLKKIKKDFLALKKKVEKNSSAMRKTWRIKRAKHLKTSATRQATLLMKLNVKSLNIQIV